MAGQPLAAILGSGKAQPRTRPGDPKRFYYQVVIAYDGDECLDWPFGRDAWGYGKLHLGGRSCGVHRLVCERAHGPKPTPKHEAAHSCGRSSCCNRNHVSWKTPAENCADKLLHGTVNRGERNGAVKLTAEQAREIMSLKGKLAQRKIARRYRIGQTTVRDIHDEKTWVWLFNAA